jgi:hypothetical protein
MSAVDLIATAATLRRWADAWAAAGCDVKALELRSRAQRCEQMARGAK